MSGAESRQSVADVERPGLSGPSERERAVLAHWRSVVEGIPGSLSRRLAFERFAPLHRGSVLASYVNGAPILRREHPHQRVFPFPFNLSQRQAVEHALTAQVSVVEGGPGMGKTQVIVNVVANLLARPGAHVAVVAGEAAGLDDVRERLDDAGVAFAIAGLGTVDRREAFFAAQASGNAALGTFVAAAGRHASSEVPDAVRLRVVDELLAVAQAAERGRSELHGELTACERERERFHEFVAAGLEPDLGELPRLAAAAPAIAEAAAVVEVKAKAAARFSAIPLFNRDSVSVTMDASKASARERGQQLIRLQGEFYQRRLQELGKQVSEAARTVEQMGAPELIDEHQALSAEAFEAALWRRFVGSPRSEYASTSYWKDFDGFLRDYPVVLSPSASLSESLSRGVMLDSVIIDGASQLDLVTAATLLACTKHVVVVGDGEPFAPTAEEAAAYAAAPQVNVGVYDFSRFSLLSSLVELYGAALPRVVLRAD